MIRFSLVNKAVRSENVHMCCLESTDKQQILLITEGKRQLSVLEACQETTIITRPHPAVAYEKQCISVIETLTFYQWSRVHL